MYIGYKPCFPIFSANNVVIPNLNPDVKQSIYHLTYSYLHLLSIIMEATDKYYINICYICEKIDEKIEKIYGSTSFHYLKFLYVYYFACHKVEYEKAGKVKEKIIDIYNKGQFNKYNYDDVKEIVNEFNLKYTGMELFEDDDI